jgi:ubiquitin
VCVKALRSTYRSHRNDCVAEEGIYADQDSQEKVSAQPTGRRRAKDAYLFQQTRPQRERAAFFQQLPLSAKTYLDTTLTLTLTSSMKGRVITFLLF